MHYVWLEFSFFTLYLETDRYRYTYRAHTCMRTRGRAAALELGVYSSSRIIWNVHFLDTGT